MAMVEALRDADPDLELWSLVPERTARAWERRMVIETGIHRWDAQSAFEDPDPLPPIVAAHGLDEFADLWLPRLGPVPVLEVTASDLGRSWRFGEGDASSWITGPASDLYLRLMAPVAPHVAEELWHRLGHGGSVHAADWPEVDEDAAAEDEVTLVVQVNGKVRDRLVVPAGIAAAEAEERALASEGAKKFLAGQTVRKVVVVPGRLVNIVAG